MEMDCSVPPRVMLSVPVNCSLELATADRSAVEAWLPLPAVTVALSVLLAAALSELSLTTMFPPVPEVPDTRLRREPVASVSTLAVMPTPEALMAEARPARVSSEEPSVMVCAVPLPTCSVTEPESVSAPLAISAR